MMFKRKSTYITPGVRLLSIVLTIFFIVVAFFSVLFAQGNVINFKDREIVPTGSIRILANKDKIDVYLDNKKKDLNDNRIENLKPGEYTLRVESQGFSPWTGQVTVNSGIVTEVRVQVFPTDLEIKEFLADEINTFYISNDKKYIYYLITNSSDPAKNGLWRHTIQESVFPIIESSKLKISDLNTALLNIASSNFDFIISPDNNKILLSNPNSKVRYIISANRFNDPEDFELLKLNFEIENVEWLGNSNHLLITTSSLLLDYNTDSKNINLINYFSKNKLNYITDGSKVYFILENEILRYENGSALKIDVEEVIPGDTNWPETIKKIENAKDNFIVFSDEINLYHLELDKMILKNLGEFTFINSSRDLKNIIVKDKNNKVFVIDVDKSRFQENYSINLNETEIPSDIKSNSITWAGDSSFFTFKADSTADEIYAASRRGGNIIKLVEDIESIPGDSILIEPNNSSIILIMTTTGDNSTSKLYKINID